MTATASLKDFDLFHPDTIENPYPFFAALRREAPLYELPNGAYYLISRFEDVQKAVMDTETYSSNLVAVLTQNTGAQNAELVQLSGGDAQASDVLAIADPPRHTRQRKVSNRAFTMRRVAAMESRIRNLAESLIQRFDRNQPVDWVAQFAVPLPMTIIIELLGFPTKDMAQLKTLSDSSVALLSGINSEEQLAYHAGKIGELFQYLSAHFDQALLAPPDNVLGNLVTAFRDEPEHFSRDEVVSILLQLLTAGNETTTSLIGSALMLLLREPGLQDRLRAQPELIPNFIEEALRLESPFHGHFRQTLRDTTVSGQHLPAGSRVMLLWAGANRDEERFADANMIELERERPKQHLAFGYGIHHCIGAALARMEAEVAIQTVLQAGGKLRLNEHNHFRHTPSLFIRSLSELWIDLA